MTHDDLHWFIKNHYQVKWRNEGKKEYKNETKIQPNFSLVRGLTSRRVTAKKPKPKIEVPKQFKILVVEQLLNSKLND